MAKITEISWNDYAKLPLEAKKAYLERPEGDGMPYHTLFAQQFDRALLERLSELANSICFLSKTKEGALDTATAATGQASIRLVADGKAAVRCAFASELKTNATYRVSFFVRMEDVRPATYVDGVYAEVWDGHDWIYLPHQQDRALFGTRDWSHVSYEFRTSPRRTTDLKPFFHFLMRGVTGTAWFDGVRIEEVKGEVKKTDE